MFVARMSYGLEVNEKVAMKEKVLQVRLESFDEEVSQQARN